jgi:tetratricopeptide (TPR) repeat protein
VLLEAKIRVMLGFSLFSRDLRSTCRAAAWMLIFLSCVACAQQAELASLHGMVRDAQGNAVADASVQLQKKDSTQSVRVQTDSRGSFVFASVHEGTYALRATKNGFADAEVASVFLAAGETKTVDLTLGFANKNDSAAASAPQFFDQPQFTVAGVTDTTALGGHGSDTVVRARNSIAKDTFGLGRPEAKTSADYAESETALRKRVEEQPSDFDANHQLGKLLLDHGKANEAIVYFEQASKAKPSDYENAYDLALANAEAGNYARAHDEASSLIALHDNAELHHLLGDVCEKLGDPLEAVHQYQRAADLDASEANVFDWGSELLLHHAPEPAEEVFAKGNRLFPRSERMLIGMGAALFAQGSYDQAVRQICDASDLHPDDPVPYLFLGKMQSAETAPSAEVVEKLHRFVTLQPQNAEANYYYAVGLWKLRKVSPDKASAAQVGSLLNNAVRLDPELARAYLQLGILYSDEKDYSRAIWEFQQAAQIDPQMEEAHYRLAQAYRQNGDADKAKNELQVYEQLTKESDKKLDRERHEIKQFVYTLRDQRTPQAQ